MQGGGQQAASSLRHATVAGWKHRALTFVEQAGVKPMPKDRGVEQGDVDGLLLCLKENVGATCTYLTSSWVGPEKQTGADETTHGTPYKRTEVSK